MAKLKWDWARHIAKRTNEKWTNRAIECRSKMEKRSRERPPTRWTDGSKGSPQTELQKLKEKIESRPGRRNLIDGACVK